MKNVLSRIPASERGIAAIELVGVFIPVLFLLLVAALLFGRCFWHYTVAEKAAHDAARFLATARPTELKVQAASGEPPIVAAAKALAEAELAELNPGSGPPYVYAFCDDHPCTPVKTAPLPSTVSIWVTMSVEDPFFSPISSWFTPDGSAIALQIDATGTFAYVGK